MVDGGATTVIGFLSLVGVAHVAIQGAKSVSRTISDLRHSSGDITKLRREISTIESLLSDALAICQEYEHATDSPASVKTLKQCLEACNKQFTVLQNIFDQSLELPKAKIPRLGKKFKFVYDKNALAASSIFAASSARSMAYVRGGGFGRFGGQEFRLE